VISRCSELRGSEQLKDASDFLYFGVLLFS
jgi:hypothetical protein